MMPEMSGTELCRKLKENPATSNIPFLLLTARSELEMKLSGFMEGADDYIIKPFQLSEVRARLKAQLHIRSLYQQVIQKEKLAALGTLIAGVAHEIRNPLNGVISSLLPLKGLRLPTPSPLSRSKFSVNQAR